MKNSTKIYSKVSIKNHIQAVLGLKSIKPKSQYDKYVHDDTDFKIKDYDFKIMDDGR